MFKDNLRKTLLSRLGVEHATQSAAVQEQMKRTCLERYGHEYHMQSAQSKEKIRKSFQSHYGVDHYHQTSESRRTWKSSDFKTKTVSFNGVVFQCQGFEHHALDWMIRVKNIKPRHILQDHEADLAIWYRHRGRDRRYFPDFYLPKENRAVEVKSYWTLFGSHDSDTYRINQKKRQATLAAGHVYSLIVIHKKVRVPLPADFLNLPRSKAVKLFTNLTGQHIK